MKQITLHSFINGSHSQKLTSKHHQTQTSTSHPRLQAQLQLSNILPLTDKGYAQKKGQDYKSEKNKTLPYLSVNHSKNKSIEDPKQDSRTDSKLDSKMDSKMQTEGAVVVEGEILTSMLHKKQSAPTLTSITQSLASKYKAQRDAEQNLCKITNTDILNLYSQLELNYQHVSNQSREAFIEKAPDQPSLIDAENQELQFDQFGEDLKHQELSKLSNNLYDLFRFKFYYFKLILRHRESPLMIFFSRNDAQLILGFKAYFSTSASFPNKFNADYIVSSKQFKLQADLNATHFTQEYLYIAIYCDFDLSLIIVTNFGFKSPLQPQKDFSVKTVLSPQRSDLHRKTYSQPSVMANQEDRMETTLCTHKLNKLQDNLNMSPHRKRNQCIQRDQKLVENENRSRLVCTRSKKFSSNKRTNIMNRVQAGLLIKDFRKYQEYMQMKKSKFVTQQTRWLIVLSLISLSQDISTRVQVLYNLYHQERALYEESCSERKSNDTMIKVRPFGQTTQQRTIFKTNKSLIICTSQIKATVKIRAKKIVTDFLQNTSLHQTLLQRHENIVNRIIVIQQKFRSLRKLKKNYRERIWKLIYKSVGDIIHELRDLKHNTAGFQRDQSIRNAKRLQQTFAIDSIVMNLMIDEFSEKQKQTWLNYFKQTQKVKFKTSKTITLIDLAAKFKQPKLYDMPNENDLKMIITKYATVKKLL